MRRADASAIRGALPSSAGHETCYYQSIAGGRTMKVAKGLAAGVIGVLLALSSQARAECSSTCSMYESGECVETTETCTAPAPPPLSYGAIAYGSTSRAYGYSYGWDNEGKAESVAMENCTQHGSDCEVMVWFEHKCGAVAAGDGTTGYWGLGNSDGAARDDAMSKCQSGGGNNCAIQVSQCSE